MLTMNIYSRWYHKDMNNQIFKDIYGENGKDLVHEEMTRSDAGLYKCEAWNYAGAREGQTHINVYCKLHDI